MVQSASVTNENDYRLTRSKVQQQSSQPQPQQQQQLDPVSTSENNSEEVLISSRQYLGDVSNQYGVAGLKSTKKVKTNSGAASTSTTAANASTAPKRRPLGGDNAPLTQKTKAPSVAPSDKITKTDSHLAQSEADEQNENENESEISSKVENAFAPTNDATALTAPRLPQKRPATESSTNLVEKLHHTNVTIPSTPANVGGAPSTSYKKTRLIDYEWQDLDEEDQDDPLMASEYVNDIFTYFYELETRMLPDSQYLYKQRHLKPKMRSILVDWLVEMHLRFRLLPESLFLAISLMDRFMSVEVVQIDKLQLLATGSLFIAAKYEEVFSPSVKNYAYFTDGSYTEEEILQAEKYILTILNFDLNYPNPMNFLRRISKADDYDVQSRTLGKYLLEITAIDYKFIGYKPSLCCASAMYLARLILGKTPVWNGNLIHYSGGYRVNDMKKCVELIFQYLISPVEHDEFFKKYATRKFMKASILCRSWGKKFHAEQKDLFDESLSTHRITLEH